MADPVRVRARRAYERARLREAGPWAAVSVPFALVAGSEAWSWLAAAALSVLLVGLKWWGRAPGRAVQPGVAAGSVGFGVPVVSELLNGGCHTLGACSQSCIASCLFGGALAGALLVGATRGPSVARGSAPIASLAVASLLTAIGCLPIGAAGLAGVAALWLLATPVWISSPQAA